ncbi:hypothetical protein Fmac_026679 [Flemingia macrophylla]|uniref:Uncharacterized protein n=1 Tax=Flemingia macrophylla TaxID=520843 RepID=A0ABD1LFI5_9FABA
MSQGYSIAETTSAQINDLVIEKVDTHLDQALLNESNNLEQDDSSDEGWQEAVPKSSSLTGRKSSSSRRPTLAKLNTNFINVSQSSRYRSKPTNFSSPRTNLNETITGPSSPVPKKYVKSASFSPKPISNNVSDAEAEKLADSKSAPASPAPSDQIAKPAPASSGISIQSAGKLYSYKEVALAPPGTIVKVVAEQSPKGYPIQQNSELGAIVVTTTNDVEDYAQKSLDEKRLSPVHEEQKEKETAVVKDNPETVNSKASDEVVEIRLQEANNVAIIEKRREVGNIKDV